MGPLALQKSNSLEQLALHSSPQPFLQYHCDISPTLHGDEGTPGAVLSSSIHGERLMLRLQLVSPCWLFSMLEGAKPFTPSLQTASRLSLSALSPHTGASTISNVQLKPLTLLAVFGSFFTCVSSSVRPGKLACLCVMSPTSLQCGPHCSQVCLASLYPL